MSPWNRLSKTQHKLTIVVLVLLLLALLITFLPTYLARYFIADTLDNFGIELEGIKTFKVNLWKREVWVGPVRFRTGATDPGQLGELGIKLRVFPTFQKHAMVERIIVRDIDITVVRDQDNAVTINGISPEQFRPIVNEESQPPVKKSKPWGVGLVDFDLRQCRLVYINNTVGTLTVNIDSLQLNNFTSWKPDDPGDISLKAHVNDIELNVSGQARPFANNVTVNLDVITRDVALAKIIAFTGPIGLDHVAGIYKSRLHHEITLFDTGRLEGHSIGAITLNDADYSRSDRFAFATKQADVNIDAKYSSSKKNDLQINGQLKLDIQNMDGKLNGETEFAANTAHIELADLTVTRDVDNALFISAKPTIEIRHGKYSGRAQLSMDALLGALRFLQTLSATKQDTQGQSGLEKWADEEVTLPKSDVTVATLHSKLSKFEFNTKAGIVALEIVTDTEAGDIEVVATERKTNIESFNSQINALHFRSGQGEMALQLAGNTAMAGYAMQGPIGQGTINTIEFNEKVELKINRGDIVLQGSANAAVKRADIQLHKTETLPQADLDVEGFSANLNGVEFSLKNKKMQWSVEVGSLIEHASVKYTEGENTRTKFDRVELRSARLDEKMNIGVEALIISGLDGLVTRQFVDGLVDHPTNESDTDSKDAVKKIESDTKESVKTKLVIGQLLLDKGAHLRFRDKWVEPPVSLDLDIKRAEVKNIDTSKPAQQAYASLLANINEFTNLELNGQATAVGPQMDMTLNGKLEDLALPPFSSYAAEFGGVYLDKGQLSTEVNISAKKGDLEGAIKLNVQQLEFKTLSEADAKHLSNKAGMPISTAASLLQDRHGNIDLKLPVSGTITDPRVDIGSAINKAVSKTLISIYPPTLVLSILSSSMESGGMTIAPIKFKSGSSELDSVARQELDKIITLTKDRPRLLLNICGRTTPEDFKELTQISITLSPDSKPALVEQRERLISEHGQKLLELAAERSRVVERYLINVKGVTTHQVVSCRPVFDPDDTGPPRVMITL